MVGRMKIHYHVLDHDNFEKILPFSSGTLLTHAITALSQGLYFESLSYDIASFQILFWDNVSYPP